jgi:hypothetical protein
MPGARTCRPFKVFGNEELLDLLRGAESHPGVPLREGRKLPRNIRGLRLRTLEAITRAGTMPQAKWPELRTLDRIAASTLASRVALAVIVRSGPRRVEEIIETGGPPVPVIVLPKKPLAARIPQSMIGHHIEEGQLWNNL